MNIATKNELSDIEEVLDSIAIQLCNISEGADSINEFDREKISKAANSVMVGRVTLVEVLRGNMSLLGSIKKEFGS